MKSSAPEIKTQADGEACKGMFSPTPDFNERPVDRFESSADRGLHFPSRSWDVLITDEEKGREMGKEEEGGQYKDRASRQ